MTDYKVIYASDGKSLADAMKRFTEKINDAAEIGYNIVGSPISNLTSKGFFISVIMGKELRCKSYFPEQ